MREGRFYVSYCLDGNYSAHEFHQVRKRSGAGSAGGRWKRGVKKMCIDWERKGLIMLGSSQRGSKGGHNGGLEYGLVSEQWQPGVKV